MSTSVSYDEAALAVVRFVSDNAACPRQRFITLANVVAIQYHNAKPGDGFPVVSVALWVSDVKDPFYEDMPEDAAQALIQTWLRIRSAAPSHSGRMITIKVR